MFKYIKKLTSVVVMFAVIIVFSSSNVYAKKVDQSLNPFVIFLIYVTGIDNLLGNGTKLSTKDFKEVQNRLIDITGKDNPYRKGEITLSQKDMKEYFECIWNDETKKFELTARGKADFEKAKEKDRREKEGNDSGGW
jgi:ABC-type nickel/cobalt efflux system permease component RcnA